MASSRSTAESSLTVRARRAAHVHIAAVSAASTALARWASAADRLAQGVGEELVRRVGGEIDSPELVDRLAAAGSRHRRELAALPREAFEHLDASLALAPASKRSTR